MHRLQKKPPKKAVHKIIDQLQALAVPIDKLEPDPDNARDHDKRNLESIVLSYDAHEQRKPIVVQERDGKFIVRAGNGQLAAVKRMGWTHIAAVIVEEGDADAVKFAIRDNRSGDLASWNLPNLATQLAYVQEAGTPLEELGWESIEYEPLLANDWSPATGDGGVRQPDRRVGLMFTRVQWEKLKEVLAAKPSAELVLARLQGRDE